MMWSDGGWSWWGWLVMSLVMVGFWAAVAWLIVTVIRGGNRHGSSAAGASPTDSAERILAERFARGEIDAAEYHQRLDDIRRHEDAA